MTKSSARDMPSGTRVSPVARENLSKDGWRLIDWTLAIAALASAAWACLVVPVGSDATVHSAVTLYAEPFDAEPSFFIDETNVIQWSKSSVDGATTLACELTAAPRDVLVLVHPDSLMEPLVRATEVLRHAGARRVRLACANQTPFPETDPSDQE